MTFPVPEVFARWCFALGVSSAVSLCVRAAVVYVGIDDSPNFVAAIVAMLLFIGLAWR